MANWWQIFVLGWSPQRCNLGASHKNNYCSRKRTQGDDGSRLSDHKNSPGHAWCQKLGNPLERRTGSQNETTSRISERTWRTHNPIVTRPNFVHGELHPRQDVRDREQARRSPNSAESETNCQQFKTRSPKSKGIWTPALRERPYNTATTGSNWRPQIRDWPLL